MIMVCFIYTEFDEFDTPFAQPIPRKVSKFQDTMMEQLKPLEAIQRLEAGQVVMYFKTNTFLKGLIQVVPFQGSVWLPF